MSEDKNGAIWKVRSESQESLDEVSEETKYPALAIISVIYRVLAIVAAVVAFIVLAYGVWVSTRAYGAKAAGMVLVIYSLVFGILGVIAFLAISEIIKLFIDLENNSRKQITLLGKLLDRK